MKKIAVLPFLFITILLVFGASKLYSQNLSIDELVSLRKNDIAYAEEFLSTKGWGLLTSEHGEDYKFSSVSFAYKKSSYDDKAESFLTYLFNPLEVRRIIIQIHKKDTYNNYLLKIKNLGCKLVDNSIGDNEIVKTYRGKTTTFRFRITTSKEEIGNSTSTIYTLLIISNEDYDLNYVGNE